MNKKLLSLVTILLLLVQTITAQIFKLNNKEYYQAGGTDVMVFSDFYPEGHQGGVCVIMNGQRIATNGDIRLEATPGQWQPENGRRGVVFNMLATYFVQFYTIINALSMMS